MPIALVRPSDWEWALLFHLLGAFLLVGGLAAVVLTALAAWRRRHGPEITLLTRFSFRTLLFVVWPSFILMRVAAEWVRTESPFDDEAGWIGVGYIVSDVGVPVLLLLTLLGWLSVRRTQRDGDRLPVTARVYGVLAPVYLLALLVAVWAMTTKPD